MLTLFAPMLETDERDCLFFPHFRNAIKKCGCKIDIVNFLNTKVTKGRKPTPIVHGVHQQCTERQGRPNIAWPDRVVNAMYVSLTTQVRVNRELSDKFSVYSMCTRGMFWALNCSSWFLKVYVVISGQDSCRSCYLHMIWCLLLMANLCYSVQRTPRKTCLARCVEQCTSLSGDVLGGLVKDSPLATGSKQLHWSLSCVAPLLVPGP